MGDWLKDLEEQNYRREMESQVRKRNELLAEQNSVLESEVRKRNEFLEKQNLAQKEFNRLQRERLIAEEKRYQRERLDRQHKEYRDKIDALKLTLAQTTDPLTREQVASLLEEAKQEYQDFLDALERQRLAEEEAEREAYQEYLRQEAEREKQEKRWRRRQHVKTLILLLITILCFILGTKWLMDIWLRGEQTASKEQAFTSNASSGLLARNSSSVKAASGTSATSSEQSQASQVSSEARTSSSASEGLGTPANFEVRVSVGDLVIRSEPSKSSKHLGVCPLGVYTIVRVYKGDNYTWGQLKSGQGWIALDFTEGVDGAIPQIATKIDTKNLTAEQVEKWVTYTIKQGNVVGLIKDIKVEKRSDNLVYVDVSRELNGADLPNDYYRISSQGYLEFDMNGSWQVVDREYHE